MPLLEQPTRLSRSVLWGFLKKSYQEKGIAAWESGQVPMHRSNNAFIAQRYAKVIAAFDDDCSTQAPITIVEIGAGAGRLAYFVTQQLDSLLSGRRDGSDPAFRYIMTDIAAGNLEVWNRCGAFDDYVARGLIDFAVFDADAPTEIRLTKSGAALEAATVPGPLVVIGNYVLDSLRQDQFRFANGEIFENLVAAETPDDSEPDETNLLSDISLTGEYQPAMLPYYDDTVLDDLLRSYARELNRESELLIPIGMHQCLDALRRLSTGPTLSLIGDLGMRFTDELDGAAIGSFRSNIPGYFWFSGNFDALRRVTNARGGMAMFSDEPVGHFVIGAFVEGASGDDLPQTRQAFEEEIRGCGPSEVRELIKGLKKTIDVIEPQTVLYLLKLSDWDPVTLLEFAPAIVRQPAAWKGSLRTRLVDALRRIGDNHYPLGNPGNVPMRLGQLFMFLNMPDDAKPWLHLSLAESGADARAYRGLAECYRLHGDFESAAKYEGLAATIEQPPAKPSAAAHHPGIAYPQSGVARRDAKASDSWQGTARNADCPCGSSLKYKHCHGKLT